MLPKFDNKVHYGIDHQAHYNKASKAKYCRYKLNYGKALLFFHGITLTNYDTTPGWAQLALGIFFHIAADAVS